MGTLMGFPILGSLVSCKIVGVVAGGLLGGPLNTPLADDPHMRAGIGIGEAVIDHQVKKLTIPDAIVLPIDICIDLKF